MYSVGSGKMSMVGQSESDDIFVSELKAKELIITGSVRFQNTPPKRSTFHQKIDSHHDMGTSKNGDVVNKNPLTCIRKSTRITICE